MHRWRAPALCMHQCKIYAYVYVSLLWMFLWDSRKLQIGLRISGNLSFCLQISRLFHFCLQICRSLKLKMHLRSSRLQDVSLHISKKCYIPPENSGISQIPRVPDVSTYIQRTHKICKILFLCVWTLWLTLAYLQISKEPQACLQICWKSYMYDPKNSRCFYMSLENSRCLCITTKTLDVSSNM